MRRTLASVLFILLTLAAIIPPMSAQQVDKKLPWSVRMTQSEMIRWPESWQLDFQPKLKWDYCHGLELGAMLDVYDTYGDKKIRDYAIAYADTMVHADGTITAYKLTDYSLDRINSGKILSVFMSKPKIRNTRKRSICFTASLKDSPVMMMAVSGTRKFIRIRCGWTDFTWELLFMQNMHSATTFRKTMRI